MFTEAPSLLRTTINISLGRLRTAATTAPSLPRQLARFSSLPPPNMAPPKSAYDFLDFVNASPTPYHAVATSASLLEAAGFQLIKERDSWGSSLKPGGKYYLTRNGSSIVAFAVGAKWRPGNPFAMVGAHTDSPCLRLKPVSKKTNVGFLQVGVECYGGGIWHSWFDRDLGVAGRALVKDADGNFAQRLVKVDRPILRIPTLAIHLDRSTEFSPNKETQLFPIAGLVAAELNRTGAGTDETAPAPDADAEGADYQPLKQMTERHHPYIIEIVAKHVGVAPADVVDFELVLFDTQKACLGGLNDEFIFSARLDNLNMTFCAVRGLIDSVSAPTSLEAETAIRLISCFDHEEIGSTSSQGANSNLLPTVIRRLCAVPPSRFVADDTPSEDNSYHNIDGSESGEASTAFEQSLATSFLISADMAHSVHPNYAAKYESSHAPEMNKGTVIKVNANQRYATNSPGIVLLQEAAKVAGVPLQLFVVRNDSPCGSTIGPMLSAKTGIRTLDLGNPQLSMHSIRETGGTYDVEHSIRLFDAFLSSYSKLEAKILVD
ncbi:hypothetical protein RB598_008160 [Gaeumannomyces tritici]